MISEEETRVEHTNGDGPVKQKPKVGGLYLSLCFMHYFSFMCIGYNLSDPDNS